MTKQVGRQPIFNLDTWFDPQGIANILSLEIITKHYPMVFDTTDNFFTVHLKDRYIVFIHSTGELYCFDAVVEEKFNVDILVSVVYGTPNKTCLLSTVIENFSWFSPHQFSRDKFARCIYITVGCPSGRDFQNMVHRHAIKTVRFL